MDSSYPTISSDDPSPAINDVSFIFNPTLISNAPLFFPIYPSPHCYYFSPPLIYLLPPPPIFMYYPLWYVNPNPNQFESIQEPSPLRSPCPSQELSPPPSSRERDFRRRRNNKMMWRRKIKQEDEPNDDHITTVMLRHIPNRYTREMMIEFMDKHCEEANRTTEKDEESPISVYDFFYLPIDFKTGMNKGYAFVNFINNEAVWKFKDACNHKSWSRFHSSKVLEIAYARIQGKYDLVKHFEQMIYPAESYSAVCFNPARTGLENTVQTIMVGKCTGPMISV